MVSWWRLKTGGHGVRKLRELLPLCQCFPVPGLGMFLLVVFVTSKWPLRALGVVDVKAESTHARMVETGEARKNHQYEKRSCMCVCMYVCMYTYIVIYLHI